MQEPASSTWAASTSISPNFSGGKETLPESQSTKKPRAMTDLPGGLMCPGVVESLMLAASFAPNTFCQADLAQAL